MNNACAEERCVLDMSCTLRKRHSTTCSLLLFFSFSPPVFGSCLVPFFFPGMENFVFLLMSVRLCAEPPVDCFYIPYFHVIKTILIFKERVFFLYLRLGYFEEDSSNI